MWGEEFSERGPNFFNYVQNIFSGGEKFCKRGLGPPATLVTGLDSSMLVSNQSSTHCPAAAGALSTRSTADRVTLQCWHRTSRIAFRPQLFLSVGLAALCSIAGCCLAGTWSAWSWRWLAVTASHLPPAASRKDPSWHRFSSTSTSVACQPLSPQSTHVLN